MDEAWGKKVDELLDGIWKLATAKYGTGDARIPPKELQQVRTFTHGLETILKREVIIKD